jgi:hypothetical protein
VDIRKYVHRVGRTARAGRTGDAWTLVEEQEVCHLMNQLLPSPFIDVLGTLLQIYVKKCRPPGESQTSESIRKRHGITFTGIRGQYGLFSRSAVSRRMFSLDRFAGPQGRVYTVVFGSQRQVALRKCSPRIQCESEIHVHQPALSSTSAFRQIPGQWSLFRELNIPVIFCIDHGCY